MSKSKVSSGSLSRGSLVAALVWLAAAPASAGLVYTGDALPGTTGSALPYCVVPTKNGPVGGNLLTGDPCYLVGSNYACTFDASAPLPSVPPPVGLPGVCLPSPAQMYFNYTWSPGLYYQKNQVVIDGTGAYIALVDNVGVQPGMKGLDANGQPTVDVWKPLGGGSGGPAGPAGPIGPAGSNGAPGATGPQGPTGNTGPMGPLGPAGALGPQGPAGTTGPIGPQGVQGPQGAQGTKGDTGPMGSQGPVGLPGAQGALGLQGPIGLTGLQGPAGLTGPQGPIGLTGPQGAAGPTGPQGPKGDTGSAGAAGAGLFPGATIIVPVGVKVPAGFTCLGQRVRFRHDDESHAEHHTDVLDDDATRWFQLCTKN